jgi:hypothetical protein
MLRVIEPADDIRDFSKLDLVALGKELAGLTGRDDLSDDEYREIAREWYEAFGQRH